MKLLQLLAGSAACGVLLLVAVPLTFASVVLDSAGIVLAYFAGRLVLWAERAIR